MTATDQLETTEMLENPSEQEVIELRRQVARLSGERSTRLRRAAVAVVVGLAIAVTFVANSAIWTDRSLLDTNDFVAATRDLPKTDAVAAAVAQIASDELFAAVDTEAEVSSLLPPDLRFAAAPIAVSVESAATDVARELIETDDFQALWTTAIQFAHQELVALLRGDAVEPLVIENGAVTLDLAPLIQPVAAQLGDAASSVIGPLDGDAGKIVLLRDEQLGTAQRAVRAMEASAWVTGIAALLLMAIAIYVSADPRRTLGVLGVAIAVAMALSLVVVEAGRSSLVAAIDDQTLREGAAAAWDVVQRGFVIQTVTVMALGLVTALGAWLVGPAPRADRARRAIDRAVERFGGDDAGPPTVSTWVATRRDKLRLWIVGLALITLLLWPGATWGTVLTVALVGLIALVLVETLAKARQGAPA